MRIETLSAKTPDEIIPVGIDFKNLVGSIDNVTIYVGVKKGVDADPNALLLSSAQTTGTDVRQLIQGGLDGVVYLIRMDVTSGSEVYSEAVYLPVKVLS